MSTTVMEPKTYLTQSEFINVPSSNGEDRYIVRVDIRVEAAYCQCKAFAYRQRCRHLAVAMERFESKAND